MMRKKDESEDKDDFINERIPRNLLAKISLLTINLKM